MAKLSPHYEPHDGDRVRIGGFDGLLGRVIRCFNRERREYYFKVKPDAGGHWPRVENVVADSQGRHHHECRDCQLFFRSDDPYAPWCPNCEQRQQARDRRQTATTSPVREGDARPRVLYPTTFQEPNS